MLRIVWDSHFLILEDFEFSPTAAWVGMSRIVRGPLVRDILLLNRSGSKHFAPSFLLQ